MTVLNPRYRVCLSIIPHHRVRIAVTNDDGAVTLLEAPGDVECPWEGEPELSEPHGDRRDPEKWYRYWTCPACSDTHEERVQ